MKIPRNEPNGIKKDYNRYSVLIKIVLNNILRY